MDIQSEDRAGGISVIHLIGRLDLLSASAVKTVFQEKVATGSTRLVVNLAEVNFVDSSGLGALIAGLKAARQVGGDLRLARVGDQARLVFELTSLDRVLRAYPTLDTAIASY